MWSWSEADSPGSPPRARRRGAVAACCCWRRATGWAAARGRRPGTATTSSTAAAGCTGTSPTRGPRSSAPASSVERRRRARAYRLVRRRRAAHGHDRRARRDRGARLDAFVGGVEEVLPLPHDPLARDRRLARLDRHDDRRADGRARPRRGGARRARGRAGVARARPAGRGGRRQRASLARALRLQPGAHPVHRRAGDARRKAPAALLEAIAGGAAFETRLRRRSQRCAVAATASRCRPARGELLPAARRRGRAAERARRRSSSNPRCRS